MPRRHNRDSSPTPLSITPSDIPRPPRIRTRDEIEADRRTRQDRLAAQAKVERRKRIEAAVSWDTCCVPGCGDRIFPIAQEQWRDVDQRLPICTVHAIMIKRQIDTNWNDEDVIRIRLERQAALDERQAEAEKRWTITTNGGASEGQIYFVRLNGLVKVGWSSNLVARLKSYGPDVEVICHYPASRQDETLMHRQLRPYLAKGREWYQDCKLIADVAEGILKRHGPPKLSAYWTEPKPPVIKARKRAG